jgi:hypothetical protein
MNLANAFTTAWKDFKSVASKISGVLVKDGPAIQTVVGTVSTAVEIADPALEPEVTSADQLEELVMGKVTAGASVAANAPTLSALFGEAWPAIVSLTATLKNHPTVTTVTAALKAPPVPAAAPVAAAPVAPVTK